MKNSKTKDMIICALMAAVMCVISPFTIPIGPIPVSLGVLGVLLTAVILGWKRGTIATAVYLLLGLVGLPVFTGFRGGLAVFAGPTGGYAYSFIIMAFITGFVSDKLIHSRPAVRYGIVFAACAVSAVICDALGTIHYMAVTDTQLKAALVACFYPFIPIDIAKSAVATLLGLKVRSILRR